MKKMSLAAFAITTLLAAQTPPPPGTPGFPSGPGGLGGRGGAPQKSTYVVHPDRTVTFELRAPDATSVELSGDFVQGSQDMKKAVNGTWSVNVGPIKRAVYNYQFTIDGVGNVEPANPMIKLGVGPRENRTTDAATKREHSLRPEPAGGHNPLCSEALSRLG
jgi:hypothetical protein